MASHSDEDRFSGRALLLTDMKLAHLRRVLAEARLYLCNHLVTNIPFVRIRMWLYRNAMKFRLSTTCTIFIGTRFHCAGGLNIGDRSVVNENCRLDPRGGISIANDSILAAEVTILTADHDPLDPTFERARIRGVQIGHHVFIGTRALVLPGVTIGNGAIVAAGSIVTRDVAPFFIVAGSPARKIGVRPPNLTYSSYYRRIFH